MSNRFLRMRTASDIYVLLYPLVLITSHWYVLAGHGHLGRGPAAALVVSAAAYGLLGVFLSYGLACAWKETAWYVQLLWCLIITVAPVGVPAFYFMVARRRFPTGDSRDSDNMWHVLFVREPFFAYFVIASCVLALCCLLLWALWP